MHDRLKAMLIKEFIQMFRDPRMRFVLIVLPVMQTIIFGYAVNTDVKQVATAVYDQDNSPESRELVAGFTSSGYFSIAAYVESDAHMRDLLDRGKVKAVIHCGAGFGETLRSGRSTPLQLILDGSDSNTAGIVLSYAGRIASLYSERLAAKSPVPGSSPPGRVVLQSRAWFNENLESRNFYVPAVIANIVLIITMLLSSMAIVREKEIGTIEQMIVTPIRKGEFIFGKTVPFVLIGFTNVALISLVAVFWFEVPLRGSLLLLFAGTALFLLSSLGFGLLISTVSRTQQQAMMSAFFFVFPAMLLSGFAFPIANMPEPVQWITYLNPLRYYLIIIREIFLKGVGIGTLWPQMAGLGALGSVIFTFAVARFQKTLS
ncbi:ABC transporter permease [Geobacter sp. DSM 9736]|uniref:ABC transporter permease n=1 Tax=Geobacter sp. DSM 9736 TaxID=1277350 RepID=UPI000B4FF0BA|nr:ABC transporter permease [Geobacter sp. DSM 9736]SNB45914.1 ABC-2 type transport system permease protein [Geobacter sp. DSM 9736]